MRRGTCDSVAGRLIEPSPRAERLDAQGFNDESGLAPPLEPPAQRVEILVTVGAQEEGHPGARRLSRLRTVKDHLAAQAAWEWPEPAARPARQRPSRRTPPHRAPRGDRVPARRSGATAPSEFRAVSDADQPDHDRYNDRGRPAEGQCAADRFQRPQEAGARRHDDVAVAECRVVDRRVVERVGERWEFAGDKEDRRPYGYLHQVPCQKDDDEHQGREGVGQDVRAYGTPREEPADRLHAEAAGRAL